MDMQNKNQRERIFPIIGAILSVYAVVLVFQAIRSIVSTIQVVFNPTIYGFLPHYRYLLTGAVIGIVGGLAAAGAYFCLAVYLGLLYRQDRGHALLPTFFGLLSFNQLLVIVNSVISVLALRAQEFSGFTTTAVLTFACHAVLLVLCVLSLLSSLRGLENKLPVYLLCGAFCVMSIAMAVLTFRTPTRTTLISTALTTAAEIVRWPLIAYAVRYMEIPPFTRARPDAQAEG